MSNPCIIIINGENCQVFCSKVKGSTRWEANGDCNGRPVSGYGASYGKAIDEWKFKATSNED